MPPATPRALRRRRRRCRWGAPSPGGTGGARRSSSLSPSGEEGRRRAAGGDLGGTAAGLGRWERGLRGGSLGDREYRGGMKGRSGGSGSRRGPRESEPKAQTAPKQRAYKNKLGDMEEKNTGAHLPPPPLSPCASTQGGAEGCPVSHCVHFPLTFPGYAGTNVSVAYLNLEFLAN